jgi:hypothetical protein
MEHIKWVCLYLTNRATVVIVVIRLHYGQFRNCGLIPGTRERRDRLWHAHGSPFPRAKPQGSEYDHPPPSSAKFQKVRCYTVIPTYRLIVFTGTILPTFYFPIVSSFIFSFLIPSHFRSTVQINIV